MNIYEILKVGTAFYVICKRHESDNSIKVPLPIEKAKDPTKWPYKTFSSNKNFADGPFETYDLANTFMKNNLCAF